MRNAIVLLVSALLLFAAGSAWLALHPAVPADLGGVQNLDSHAKHVRIPVGEDDQLDGWYLAGSRPVTVLLFAGYARDHRRMWRYAHFLSGLGLHVLNVDFRSARPLRRKPTTLGYWEVRDARAALDWVRANPALRGHRVVLYGESLGGAAALALAAERPYVAVVVADCPFASADQAIVDGLELVYHVPAMPFAPLARLVGRGITGHDPGELDVTKALRALQGRPVLVIQTRREDRFSRRHVERITQALGLYGETWILEDVKHTEAWLDHREQYERRVSGFLRTHLGLPRPAGAGKASAAGKKTGAAGRAASKTPGKPGSR